MQNIKIPQAIGNSIARFAYLDLIADSIKKQGDHYYIVYLQGYSYESDMVHFTYGGKRCILYGVAIDEDSIDTGDFYILVKAKNGKPEDSVRNTKAGHELWEVPVNVKDFRFKTLDRIAYEVYDYCKREDDDDYEEARKEYIADGMDDYREFMS